MIEGNDSEVTLSNIPSRLDNLRWSPWHTLLALGLGCGWCLDAFESTAMSMALNTIGAHFNVTPMECTYLNTTYFFGALTGTLFMGVVSERQGRKYTALASLGVYLVSATLSALVPMNWELLLTLRFAVGFAMGSENGTVSPILNEMLPARHRGKVAVLTSSTFDLASCFVSLIMAVCLSRVDPRWNWKLGMFIGIGVSLPCLLIRFLMPESPRWLLSRGRLEAAEMACRNWEEKCGVCEYEQSDCGAVEINLAGDRGEHLKPALLSLRELFTTYKIQLLYSAGLNGILNFSAYGFTGYSQLALMPFCNVSESTGAYIYMTATGVNSVTNSLAAYLFDRVGRKPLILTLYCLTLAAGSFFFLSTHMRHSFWAIAAVTVVWKSVEAPAANTAIAAGAEVFPTRVTAMGNALSHGVGRLFGAFSQSILLKVFTGSNPLEGGEHPDRATGLLLGLYGCAIAICVLWCFKGVEGAGTQLETVHRGLRTSDTENDTATLQNSF